MDRRSRQAASGAGPSMLHICRAGEACQSRLTQAASEQEVHTDRQQEHTSSRPSREGVPERRQCREHSGSA